MNAAGVVAAAGVGGQRFALELEALAVRLRRVTARVHTRGRGRFSGVGAGVIWSRDGLVVTNAHVAPGRRGQWPIVELFDGRSFEARLLARDAERDLALLALERSELEAATIGDARSLRVGEILVAVGHPFGLGGSLSVGVVHAVRRGDAEDAWIRADIRLAPGNSGGPLATLEGSVIGINSMVVRGLGVAVSAHVVEQFVHGVMRSAESASP